MSLKHKQKRAVSLVEVVITLALTSIILLEVTTFIVYANNQTIYINQQSECYSIISSVKLRTTNIFNNTQPISGTESDLLTYIDDVETEIKQFVTNKKYDKYIDSDSIEIRQYKKNETYENVYVCTFKYRINEQKTYETFMFVLTKHVNY